MSVCKACDTRLERPCTFAHVTREMFDALIPALKFVARRYGYALAVHGSLKTDIDLLAAPWRDSAPNAYSFAEAIRACAESVIGTARIREHEKGRLPEKKPCGRLAWSFWLVPEGVEGPYIDLSVMPRGPQDFEAKRKKKR